MEQLDYDPDSAGRPYSDVDHDFRGPQEHDGRSNYQTGFEASDAAGEKVERNGTVYENKWRWLAYLNQNGYSKNRKKNERKVERKRDIDILVSSCNEYARRNGLEYDLDVREVHKLLDTLVDDGDYRFGPKNPVEIPILAALSIVANRQNWMIRQTDLFTEFVESYIPKDSDADRGEIMRMRQKIRDAMD
jgi:hypothetical protein